MIILTLLLGCLIAATTAAESGPAAGPLGTAQPVALFPTVRPTVDAVGITARDITPRARDAAASPAALMPMDDDDQDSDETADDTNAGDDDDDAAADEQEELKLEDLFPERSFFGPGASQMGFSHEGRYGSYLYRPYDERRHGNDLWIYDTQTGNATRITKATVMARFQESTRTVVKDRIEKARKAGLIKKEQEEKENGDAEDTADTAESRPMSSHRRTSASDATSSRAKVSATPDDGASGTWKCVVVAEEVGSVEVTLELVVDAEGNVTGSAKSTMGEGAIRRGTFDTESGRLSLRIDATDGEQVTIDGTIADGRFEGEVAMGIYIAQMTGTRTVVLTQTDRDDEQRDRRDDDTDDDDSDNDDTGDGDDEQNVDDSDDIDEREWGDWVSDKDAEDTKSPRYAGVSTYTWSPNDDELLFVSQGDLYRFEVPTNNITRLTKTNSGVRDVQYWPDGSGYTYMQGSSLMRVEFGSHLIKQLDPDLPRGESMSGYRVSPDGERLVFLTSRTISSGSNRTVTIVDYRSRFARAREVRRTVSDDPQTEREVSIYLYETGDPLIERSRLARVFTYKLDRPRDVIRVPHWSPDSTRIAFSMFEQSTSQIAIYEASLSFPDAEGDDAVSDDQDNTDAYRDENEGDAERDGADDDEEEQDGESDGAARTDQDEELQIDIEDAREVYRFLHYGGPNTPRMVEPMYLADNRHMVFITEQSGFRHLHRLDPVYQALDQLTRGRFEVYPIEMCKDHRYVFATSTAEDLTREDVYRIDTETGEMQRLSSLDGRHTNVAVCPRGEHVLANFVTYGRLRELVAFNRPLATNGSNGDDGDNGDAASAIEPMFLTDSHPEEAHKRTKPQPEFFTYENRHGHDIHGMMFKPDNWEPEDKRPLLIYVYGGPLSSNNKQVLDGSYSAPGYFFAYYMAKKHGYVTVTIDPRGTSGYGGLFEKANFEQVGKPQTEDLVDGVKWLIANHGVDENRVGMHGWSFGGFQTQMCMYTEPDVFQVGIAGAGPTEWHNYNSWYSTGTIGDSRRGQTDLEAYSLIPLAKNLKGRLLLVHGVEDSNVLYQDTVKVYAALLEAGKETLVDLFIDPSGGHGLGGQVKTVNRYRKYEDFLLLHLGNGKPAGTAGDDADGDA